MNHTHCRCAHASSTGCVVGVIMSAQHLCLTVAEDTRLSNTVCDQDKPVRVRLQHHLYSSLTRNAAMAVPPLAKTCALRHAWHIKLDERILFCTMGTFRRNIVSLFMCKDEFVIIKWHAGLHLFCVFLTWECIDEEGRTQVAPGGD